MNLKRIMIVGVVALFSVVFFSQAVFAQGFYNPQKIEKLQTMLQKHQKIQEAIEKGDFDLWKSAVSINGNSPKVLEKITAENFPSFVQAHKLMQEGKSAEAQKIMESLGFNNPGQKLGKNIGKSGQKGSRGQGCACGCAGGCMSGSCSVE